MEPPRGFVRLDRDGAELVLRAGLEDALLAAGVAFPERLVAQGDSGLRGRGALARLELPIGKAVLRLYRRGGLLGKVVRRLSLDPERARSELALHAHAIERGASVAEPLAAITRRAGPGFAHALATREVENARDLERILAETRGKERRRALAAAGEAVRRLHEAGIDHVDLNVKNVLVVGEGGRDARPTEGGRDAHPTGPTGVVIDLDRGRAELDEAARRRNLVRLLRSAIKLSVRGGRLEPRDPFRFARAYARGDRQLQQKITSWGRAALPWIRLRSIVWRVFA
jgi:3-deoxy-D-manno-octulosonic acid kinase